MESQDLERRKSNTDEDQPDVEAHRRKSRNGHVTEDGESDSTEPDVEAHRFVSRNKNMIDDGLSDASRFGGNRG